MVSSALASTHVKEDPPALQYWKEVLNPIANDCVAIGERYRSDLLAEIAALITRWKRLAATGVEAAPPEFYGEHDCLSWWSPPTTHSPPYTATSRGSSAPWCHGHGARGHPHAAYTL